MDPTFPSQGTVKLPVSDSLVKLIVKYCTQENPDLRATPTTTTTTTGSNLVFVLQFTDIWFPPPCREGCSSWYPIHLLKTSPLTERRLYFLLRQWCLPVSRPGIWPSCTHRVCCTRSRCFYKVVNRETWLKHVLKASETLAAGTHCSICLTSCSQFIIRTLGVQLVTRAAHLHAAFCF